LRFFITIVFWALELKRKHSTRKKALSKKWNFFPPYTIYDGISHPEENVKNAASSLDCDERGPGSRG
jgi:hypothetical protein